MVSAEQVDETAENAWERDTVDVGHARQTAIRGHADADCGGSTQAHHRFPRSLILGLLVITAWIAFLGGLTREDSAPTHAREVERPAVQRLAPVPTPHRLRARKPPYPNSEIRHSRDSTIGYTSFEPPTSTTLEPTQPAEPTPQPQAEPPPPSEASTIRPPPTSPSVEFGM